MLWNTLLNSESKKKWREHIGKVLKKSLADDFGKIDEIGIKEAIRIDKIGFIKRAKEINNYDGFNSTELGHVTPYI